MLSRLPEGVQVSGCVVFDVSPSGKKEGLVGQAMKTWKTFGTGFFLNYSLRFLQNKLNKQKKVKSILQKHSIPVIELQESINAPSSLQKIKAQKPDLLISIAGNQIFKEELINLAPEGCLNLHTALLPKYRGLMPTFWVLKNGEEYTGVSVFFVDKGIDSGPVLVQKKIEIGNRSQKELIQDTKKLGMDAIVEAIDKIRKGGYELIPNPDEEKTYFSFPTKEDVKEFKETGKRFY